MLVLCLCGCYSAGKFTGPYRCGDNGACGEGLVCDDGVCCMPLGEPQCRSYVLDGGTCADGSTPKTYYQDLDGDGWGNDSNTRLYCAQPVSDPYVAQGGDCIDTPDALGQLSHPGAAEVCDGYDNNCDGQVDEGLPRDTYYADQDNDGWGAADAGRLLCTAIPGWVANSGDCAPNDGTRHPDAGELCNGLDDNCNGLVDEAPVAGTGLGCAVPGAKGVCVPGQTVCLSGTIQCGQTVQPTPDICDGLDNNCDGQVDNQPDCGGPKSLLGTQVGIRVGAQDTNKDFSGTITTTPCLKDTAGFIAETWNGQNWSGSGDTTHVLFAENTTGTWDLSKPGAVLHMKFTTSMVNPGNPAWVQESQPNIFLCGTNGGHVRLVHNPSVPYLLSGPNNTVDQLVPLGGGTDGGWIIGVNSSLDITRVKWIEIVVQPGYNATAPQFTVSFTALGFQ